MNRPRLGPRYVLITVFCVQTGYTEKAVERKREEGVWRIGQVLRKAPDGHIMVDLDGYEAWVEGEKVAA